jgi:hypothetical protein
MSLPSGYEGIILSGEQAPVTNLPLSFRGVVLSYSGDTIFVNVKNGLGKPIVGVEVSTPFGLTTLTGFTDENGNVAILCNATGTITFKKDKTFRTRSYIRSTDGALVNFVYNVPVME